MTAMTRTTPRHYFKHGKTVEQMTEEVLRLHGKGKGPLSIAVRLGVDARFVMHVLSKNEKVEGYEPQCWSLSSQFL